MRSRTVNMASRAAVAVLVMCALAGGLSGCGSGASAVTLVRDTFNSHKPIESGRVDLDLHLSGTGGSSAGTGSSALEKPVALTLSGPFQGAGPGKVPRFSLQFGLTSAGQTIKAGATSADGGLYIELEGMYFKAPDSVAEALRRNYRKASKSSSGSSFQDLGISPGKWLTDPVNKGEVTLNGERTVHIEGGLDAKALLKDTGKLTGAGGSLGLAGATEQKLSPKVVSQLGKSVSSAHIDVYTGASDHLLRRLLVHATLQPKTAEARSALGGLSKAEMTLRLSLSELGKRQIIAAPREAKPLSQLLEVLKQLGLVGETQSTY